MKKVAVIGNSSFPIDANTGTQIVDVMREFGKCVFLTRGSPGVDRFVMYAAIVIGRPVFKYPATGGPDNLHRDRDLVTDADCVIAFLDPESMDARTGTMNVIEAALNAHKPTRAYTLVDGRLVWAGETDEAPA